MHSCTIATYKQGNYNSQAIFSKTITFWVKVSIRQAACSAVNVDTVSWVLRLVLRLILNSKQQATLSLISGE